MEFDIRPVGPEDISSLLELTREFAVHARLSHYFETTSEKLIDAMFGERAFVRGLIASVEDVNVGYALYFPGFLSFRGQRSVFLEDLYVQKEFRSHGIGKKLIARAARSGRREFGAVRLDLNVDATNTNAIDLYVRLGGELDTSEHRIKYIDGEFTKLAR